MKVIVTARNFDLVEGTKKGIESELQRVDKMLPDNVMYDVTLLKEMHKGNVSYKCDILVKGTPYILKGEFVGTRIEHAIDGAVTDLKRKLRKVKTALIDKNRAVKSKGIEKLLEGVEPNDATDTVDYFNINKGVTKRKTFELECMSEDEAILQLELTGHSFFAFRDVYGDILILYRRKDGYGTIYLD